MRDGSAPTMAGWITDDGYRLAEWETDLSSQTGASQAGILLGSNEDIPAFRWVEKESGRLLACSSPADCAPSRAGATVFVAGSSVYGADDAASAISALRSAASRPA